MTIDLLRTLAEPRRLEIVRLLRGGERSAGAIAAHFKVTRPTISHHLSYLRESGLVQVRRDGTRRLYSLNPERFRELSEFLRPFWDDRLERLRASAERRHSERGRGERN